MHTHSRLARESRAELPVEACLAMPYTRKATLKRRRLDMSLKTRELLFTFIGTPRGQPTREAFGRIADEEGVLLGYSTAKSFVNINYEDAMARSIFCFVPRGDWFSSGRLFDAMAASCVPVIASDDLVDDALPFSELIPWDMFVVRVAEQDFVENPLETLEWLRKMPATAIEERQSLVRKYAEYVDMREGDGVLWGLMRQLGVLKAERVNIR